MKITFWGVRGTIPAPGGTTLRYGGNTTCISVELDDQVLMLDAGTGIRRLGATLFGQDKSLFLLLTHLHSDHIQGFPFFAPFYEPGRVVYVLDYERDGKTWTPLSMFDGVHMPVRYGELVSDVRRIEHDGLALLHEHGFHVARLAVNHPGGAYGYRVEAGGRVLVFIPDNELEPPGTMTASFEDIAAFCQGADVLCHDAQYLPGDMPMKWGWGHSQFDQACQLAIAAQARHLVLIHHDPERDDDTLDRIQEKARGLVTPHGIACTAAYEGLSLTI